MYIYIYIYTCTYIYIYIYNSARDLREPVSEPLRDPLRRPEELLMHTVSFHCFRLNR